MGEEWRHSRRKTKRSCKIKRMSYDFTSPPSEEEFVFLQLLVPNIGFSFHSTALRTTVSYTSLMTAAPMRACASSGSKTPLTFWTGCCFDISAVCSSPVLFGSITCQLLGCLHRLNIGTMKDLHGKTHSWGTGSAPGVSTCTSTLNYRRFRILRKKRHEKRQKIG